jgi:capsular polysaccharide biosynthesis protein
MQENESFDEEQEFDLGEYLKVLIKGWKLIVFITVAFTIISIVYSLLVPNVYKSIALIEPAKIQKSTVENAPTLEVLFKNPLNPYLVKIAKNLKLREEQAYSLPKRFNIVEKMGFVSVSGEGGTPKESKELVDSICSLILERYEILLKPAVEIVNNEIDFLNLQMSSTKEEIESLNKKRLTKEKTNIVAQAYIYQSMIEARENALARSANLSERLREREMEKKYFTKPATIVAEATLPEIKIAPQRRKIVSLSIFVGFIFSIFLIFVIRYFKNIL